MRSRLVISLIAFGVFAGLWFRPLLMQPRFDAGLKPALDSRSPESVDLTVRLEHVATLTNTEPLMSLLRAGNHVPNHLCSFEGVLGFHFSGGDSNGVAILPGHTNANYEFRCSNGYFAVPRDAFMKALAVAGVDTNRIPTK